jgi:hypothetical protein
MSLRDTLFNTPRFTHQSERAIGATNS